MHNSGGMAHPPGLVNCIVIYQRYTQSGAGGLCHSLKQHFAGSNHTEICERKCGVFVFPCAIAHLKQQIH